MPCRSVDLIHFADDQLGTVAQHRAADLGADDRLLDHDLAVVLPGGRDGGVQLVRALDLGHAERRAGTRRLDEDGVRQARSAHAVSAPSRTENSGVSIPALRATTYASDLSMQIAELWMPQPT